MLNIKSLSVSYGSRRVLNNIDLEIQPGEILALIGPNGAGKSTLIRALSGVIPAQSGTVTLNGLNAAKLSSMQRARRISVVPQAVSLPPAFTVWETVLLGRTPYLNFLGQVSAQDEALAFVALEQVDAIHLKDSLISEISGGEQQRVLLARALVQDTPIMLMDEPTTHLDLRHQLDLLKLMADHTRKKNLAVLATLHDLNLASMFADRIAIMQGGVLCVAGTPQETITSEIINSVYGVPVHIVNHPDTNKPLIMPSTKP